MRTEDIIFVHVTLRYVIILRFTDDPLTLICILLSHAEVNIQLLSS